MDVEKIAERILDRDWEYLDDWFDGECWSQAFYGNSLRRVIIEEINNEISKEQS